MVFQIGMSAADFGRNVEACIGAPGDDVEQFVRASALLLAINNPRVSAAEQAPRQTPLCDLLTRAERSARPRVVRGGK